MRDRRTSKSRSGWGRPEGDDLLVAAPICDLRGSVVEQRVKIWRPQAGISGEGAGNCSGLRVNDVNRVGKRFAMAELWNDFAADGDDPNLPQRIEVCRACVILPDTRL